MVVFFCLDHQPTNHLIFCISNKCTYLYRSYTLSHSIVLRGKNDKMSKWVYVISLLIFVLKIWDKTYYFSKKKEKRSILKDVQFTNDDERNLLSMNDKS